MLCGLCAAASGWRHFVLKAGLRWLLFPHSGQDLSVCSPAPSPWIFGLYLSSRQSYWTRRECSGFLENLNPKGKGPGEEGFLKAIGLRHGCKAQPGEPRIAAPSRLFLASVNAGPFLMRNQKRTCTWPLCKTPDFGGLCFLYYKRQMMSCFHEHPSAKQRRRLSMIYASRTTTTGWEFSRRVTSSSVNALTVQMGKWRLVKVTHLVGGKDRAAALLRSRLAG